MHRLPCRLLLALILLAPMGWAARADDAPPPNRVEALRLRLLAAFDAAPRVLRSYSIQTGGTPEGLLEVFHERDRQALRITREGVSTLIVSNGQTLRIQSADEQLRVVAGWKAQDELWQPYRLGVEWLGALWGVPVTIHKGYVPGYSIGVREGAEGRPDFFAELISAAGTPLSWLQQDAWRGAVVGEPPVQGLVVLKRADVEIVLHLEDGFPSRMGGTAAGKPWSMTEVPPISPAHEWMERIDALCSAPAPGGAQGNFGGYLRARNLALALQALRHAAPDFARRPDRLGIAARVLARTAFLSRDVEAWSEGRIVELRKWVSESYQDPANQDSKQPGARLKSLEELTKYAREQFLEDRLRGAQGIIDDALTGLRSDRAWSPEEGTSIGTRLGQAARELMVEYLDERWPAK